jgi:hypothetical protein
MIPVVESRYLAMQVISEKKKEMKAEELFQQVAKKIQEKELKKAELAVEEEKEKVEVLRREQEELIDKRKEIVKGTTRVLAERLVGGLSRIEKAQKQKEIEGKALSEYEVGVISEKAARIGSKMVKTSRDIEELDKIKAEKQDEVEKVRQEAEEIVTTAKKEATSIKEKAKAELKSLRNMVSKALKK